MRILFLSRWCPLPANNGSKIRISAMLKHLARRHEITLLAFDDDGGANNEQVSDRLADYCSSVRVLPYRGFRPGHARGVLGFLSLQPRSLVDTHSADMRAAVADALRHRRAFDVVVASQIDMLPYALPHRDVPAVLEELELSGLLDAVRTGSPPRRLRASLTWFKLCRYLRLTLPRFTACTVASEIERVNVQQAIPKYSGLHVVPNAVEAASYQGDFGSPCPNTLVFTGALTYRPNYDALRYFLERIYPSIESSSPQVRFRFTGKTSGVDLARLPRYVGVEPTGHLVDVRPIIAQSWATVVPLRVGGGTRLKILESMVLGTPVVSTSKGAEGLDVTHGENILIADDPSEFARHVVSLFASPTLRARIADGGRRLVESRYDTSVVGKVLETIVERAGVGAAA